MNSGGTELRFTTHDRVAPEEAAVVDTGLGKSNEEAAPLREVHELAVFAREPSGTVIGGAVGRTWGACCELKQLWVSAERRGEGTGTQLVQHFEQRALQRGCRLMYLDTFNFQARPFYEALGYGVVLELPRFTHSVVKYTMTKTLVANERAA